MSRSWRAVPLLTAALLTRLVREGPSLRALVWPGLLSAASLVGTALVVGVLRGVPTVAVAIPALAPLPERGGFEPHVVADPLAEFEPGRVGKALVPTEKGLRPVTRTTSQELQHRVDRSRRDRRAVADCDRAGATARTCGCRRGWSQRSSRSCSRSTASCSARPCSTAIARRGVIEAEPRCRSRSGRTRSLDSSRPASTLVVAYVTTLRSSMGSWDLPTRSVAAQGSARDDHGRRARPRRDGARSERQLQTPLSKAPRREHGLFRRQLRRRVRRMDADRVDGDVPRRRMPGVAPLALSFVVGGLATFVFHRRGFEG
jgi:hypothetical protein